MMLSTTAIDSLPVPRTQEDVDFRLAQYQAAVEWEDDRDDKEIEQAIEARKHIAPGALKLDGEHHQN